MANTDRRDRPAPARQADPPGATNRASDRDERPGRLDHTPLDDRHAAGTPGGGSAVGGLGGTNIGEGHPEDVPDLNERLGSGTDDRAPGEDGGPPYAGPSGGAVGGTPAEDRSTGGRTGHGIAPGSSHRGDSTIGSNPDS